MKVDKPRTSNIVVRNTVIGGSVAAAAEAINGVRNTKVFEKLSSLSNDEFVKLKSGAPTKLGWGIKNQFGKLDCIAKKMNLDLDLETLKNSSRISGSVNKKLLPGLVLASAAGGAILGALIGNLEKDTQLQNKIN